MGRLISGGWGPAGAGLAAIGVLALLVGCAGGPPGPDQSTTNASATDASSVARPLRVGVARNMAPLIFEEDGRTVGLEADFARALGEQLGRPVQFVPMFWPRLIDNLAHGRLDLVMAGVSVTPERQREVAFAQPYLVTGQQAMVLQARRPDFPDTDAVLRTDQPVGVEVDSTGSRFVARRMAAARPVAFPTLDKAIDDLLAGEIAIVIYDAPVLLHQTRQRGGEQLALVPGRLTEEPLAWAINPDDPELLKQVNAVLAQWRASGKLDQMLKRWGLSAGSP